MENATLPQVRNLREGSSSMGHMLRSFSRNSAGVAALTAM